MCQDQTMKAESLESVCANSESVQRKVEHRKISTVKSTRKQKYKHVINSTELSKITSMHIHIYAM